MNAFFLALMAGKYQSGGGGGGGTPSSLLAFNETNSPYDVHVYDAVTMIREYSVTGTSTADAIAFSQDQSLMAISRPNDGSVTKVFNSSDGTQISALSNPSSATGSGTSVFGSDTLYTSINVSPYVYRYNISDWSVQSDYATALPRQPKKIQESPDGQLVAYTDAFGGIHIYSTSTNLLITSIAGGSVSGNDIAWSSDSQYIAIARSFDGAAIYQRSDWSQVGSNITPQYTGTGSYTVRCVAFSPDDSLLILGNSYGSMLHRYTWPALTYLGVPSPQIPSPIYDVDFNQSGTLLSASVFNVNQRYRVFQVSDWSDVSSLSPTISTASSVTSFS